MDAKIAKELGNRHRFVVDLKNTMPTTYAGHEYGASCAATSQLPVSKPLSVKLRKRKRSDVCKNTCSSCNLGSQRSLARRYTNLKKSGLPARLMIYHDEWVDLSSEILGLVRKEFEQKKAIAEVNLDDCHLVLDFLHMVQVDMKTSLEYPLAWIDQSGRPYFPETYAVVNEENVCCGHADQNDELPWLLGSNGTQEMKLQIDIDLNGIGANGDLEYCSESNPLVKRIKVVGNPAINDFVPEVEDSCDRVSDAKISHAVEPVGVNHYWGKELDGLKPRAFEQWEVKESFFRGMVDFPGNAEIIEVRQCSAPILQGRKEFFLKQLEIITKSRVSANVRYAWLFSDKKAITSFETYGLLNFGLPKIEPSYGVGVHLAAEFGCYTSSKYCDVDENGVRHMVFCRVILGNMEPIQPGSRQFCPSSEKFDSGVDDLEKPLHHVVWLMNVNTHIYPEYIVSFKLSADCEGNLVQNAHKALCPGRKLNMGACPVDMVSEYHSNATEGSKERLTVLSSNTRRTPKSPWMPFPLLFESIADKVSPDNMRLVNMFYKEFRNKKIRRDEFISKLRFIVGDDLLRSTLTKLQYKGPVKNEIAA